MRRSAWALAAALAVTACSRPAAPGWSGYVEGDYVHVAAPIENDRRAPG